MVGGHALLGHQPAQHLSSTLTSHQNLVPTQISRHRHKAQHLQLRQQRDLVSTNATAQQQTAEANYQSWIDDSKARRLEHLEEQALQALKQAAENFKRPAFPCALIAGDVVILHLLHRLGYLSNEKVKVIFIDTFHLFDETLTFMQQLEDKYNLKVHEFHAKDCTDVKDFRKKHGSDLFIRSVEEYDRICKVEPFNRSLKELQVDVMINGRRRDHGFERAHLEVFEAGDPVKCNPLAYWEFRDCWDYIHKHKLAYHPLHDQGYPSIGDAQSTVPVPKDKWFEYAGERSGRFQGLTNPDGSLKTECGIHVEGEDAETGLSNIRR